jgi:type IV pilus assembly protein PilO
MTVSDYTRNDYDQRAEPAKVFGLPVPTLLGWLFGVGGLLLAGFLVMNVLIPLKDETDSLTAEVQEGERRIEQKAQIETDLKQAKADLVKVERQKQQVMSLFAEEKNLKTILFDLNQQVEKNNGRVKGARDAKIANCPAEWRREYADPNPARWQQFEEKVMKGPLVAEAKLKSFTPAKEGIQTIEAADVAKDTYLKAPLVGQLRRQTTDIAFEGTFAQAQSIFQAIEKLKPLLIVKDLKVVRKTPITGAQSDGIYAVTPNGVEFLASCQPEIVTVTSFKLDALLPLKPVEPEPTAAKAGGAAATPAATPAATASPKP